MSSNETFYHKTKMLEHLEKAHMVHTKSVRMSFPSASEFQNWKEEEESNNYVYFSKQCGTSTGNNFKYNYFVCQQDGHDKPHRKFDDQCRKTARRNSKGVVKSGLTCPARILTKPSLAGIIDLHTLT